MRLMCSNVTSVGLLRPLLPPHLAILIAQANSCVSVRASILDFIFPDVSASVDVAIALEIGYLHRPPRRSNLKTSSDVVKIPQFGASEELAPFVGCKLADGAFRVAGIGDQDVVATALYRDARTALTGA